jgi:hypothetical protein
MTSKTELKSYFENGDIPNQEQFWAWMDSYWHKEEVTRSKCSAVYQFTTHSI